MIYDSDDLCNVDPEYPLVPGDWRIFFLDKVKKEVEEMYVVITKLTRIKELTSLHDGRIIQAKRVK